MPDYPHYPDEGDPQATQTYTTFHVSTMRPDDKGKWWHTSECGPIDGFGTYAEAAKVAEKLEAKGWRALVTTQVTVSHLVYVSPEFAS